MASVTPRASGFWEDRMNYEDDAEQGMDDVEVDSDSEAGYDGRTPLDKTIDRIGMGALCFRTSCVLTLTSTRELSVDTAVLVRIR